MLEGERERDDLVWGKKSSNAGMKKKFIGVGVDGEKRWTKEKVQLIAD